MPARSFFRPISWQSVKEWGKTPERAGLQLEALHAKQHGGKACACPKQTRGRESGEASPVFSSPVPC